VATTTLPANASGIDQAHRRVIFASSLGTVFEWYDFYLYGSLAAIISKQFFSGVNETTGFIFALLAFAAGFFVRPFGALIFGRLGDLAGRKYTFLITIVIMGLSTALVGLLPTYASVGVAAPVSLIVLRLLQGLALGGEYGGAATYVGEHAPPGKRGLYTSWIQTTATLGLFLSLIVVLLCRSFLGPDFDTWGWRIPFLLSIILLAISVYIRLQLAESPVFLEMKSSGTRSKAPLTESFGRWDNGRLVLLALLGATAGQAVVWYAGQFYALFFLTQVLKVDAQPANLLIAGALVLGTPFFIVFGRLSDRIGRKKIVLLGCLLAAVTYIPIFQGITHYANPAIEKASATSPVVVHADPNACTFQFDPVGKKKFVQSCDVAKAALAKAGVPYSTDAAAPGSVAEVRVGNATPIPSVEGGAMSGADFKAATDKFAKSLSGTLKEAGYPAKANPDQINYPMVLLLLWILVIYVTMVYGPIAAWLIELFPARIRYTSMSLPYHIGNGWFGGFLPAVSFALVALTGNIYYGLRYPIIVALMTVVIGALFLPETKDRDVR
jgi:MFS family permease